MFEELADQFHQFLVSTSSSSSSLPLHISHLHASSSSTTNPNFSCFDHTSFLHQTSQPTSNNQENCLQITVNLDSDHRDSRSFQEHTDLWSNDEVLALLRIRSSMENWLPDFTWEHVSRKLAEHGFRRSAEKCKQKFEEESRFFNNNINYSKNNYRIFSELEGLYNHNDNYNDNQNHQQIEAEEEKNKNKDKASREEGDDDEEEEEDNNGKQVEKSKKRKRQKGFEMFKSFCEDTISKILDQQEEMYNKFLEDMVKRDEEKLAREEAWRKQEMDMINKELEIRAQQQVLASDRESKIIKILKGFSMQSSAHCQNPSSKPESSISTTIALGHQSSSPENPSSSSLSLANTQNPKFLDCLSNNGEQKRAITPNDKDDHGKRWPKHEVLELINLRCNLCNNNEDHRDATTLKAPLWERVSQKMLELGYKRSAKRCKEKWENINKYFRKTKDIKKNRPADSRTCPYFHQLSALYNQGGLAPPPEMERRPVDLLENGTGGSVRSE